MYQSPFGSIFGQEETTPKTAAPEVPVPQAAAPTPAEPTQPQSQALMQEMSDRIEQVEKEEVYQPRAKKITGKKSIFDRTMPQFRAEVEVEHHNPAVKAVQSRFALNKTKIKLNALKRKLASLKRKHASAKLYNDMLVQYSQLSAEQKGAVDSWISTNMESIKKFASARKLKKLALETKEASVALDAEIKFLEELKKLKKEGINVKGNQNLRLFRMKKGLKKVRDSKIVPDQGPIPKLVGKVPVEDLVRLGKENLGPTLQGFSDGIPPKTIPKKEKDVVVTRESAKKLHKSDKFKQIIAEGLRGKRYYHKLYEERVKTRAEERDFEEDLLLNKQLTWKISSIEKEINKEISDYNTTQETLKKIVQDINTSNPTTGEQTTTAIGILSEAQPEKFVASATLLDALKNSFKLLSQLGYFGQTSSDPAKEADIMLAKAAKESEDSIRELETRQNTVNTLEAEVEDKPAPPPVTTPTPVIIVQVREQIEKEEQEKEVKQERIKKATTILPMIIGGIILLKLFGN